MKLYIDISEFLNNRFTTGIQRVVREFLKRVIIDNNDALIIYYNSKVDTYELLENEEVALFLEDIKNYKFQKSTTINIFNTNKEDKMFFDLDSVWNNEYQRVKLYKKLKEFGFTIYNFVYDLIPVLFPTLVKDKTRNSFDSFLSAIYTYSDFVFFDSKCAKNDFINFKKKHNNSREIGTKVVYLGSDFMKTKQSQFIAENDKYKSLLDKKYILFVGTIEPRKQQPLLVEAFEELYKKNKDLHIIFIGSIGWTVEDFKNYLYNHPLKDKNIHHLVGIDDNTLNLFYQNAFLVTYLSNYEGYGLPIAESLLHGNITITSNNSSMPEVGKDSAIYIENNKKELICIVTQYLGDKKLYEEQKQYIKENYKQPNWNDFYNNIINEIK